MVDAALNLTAMRHEDIYTPWEAGFGDGPGGCPVVQPAKCEGSQCGDRRGVAMVETLEAA